MAIKQEPVNGGKKIVLRQTSGAEKGQLVGSVSLEGRDGIRSPQRPRAALPFVEDIYETPDVNETYLRFLANEPGVYDRSADVFDPAELRSKWLDKLSEEEQLAYLVSRTVPSGLGEDQAQYVYEALSRSMKNNKTKWDLQPPTDEQWEEFLAQTAARIADEDNGLSEAERLELLDKLGKVAAGPKPEDPVVFATCVTAASRTWRARYALGDHARQIGSWIDADEWEVKANVAKFREEYYQLVDAGHTPDIPAKYFKAWRQIKTPVPKDEATIYSHWKAENPELYLDPAVPKKFVALDLETTGISTSAHHIIEIGFVEYDSKGRETGRWTQFVRPPAEPDGSISTGDETVRAVHKITPEMVADAPTFAEIIPELRERLKGATVIGHNLAFDTGHLRANLRKHAAEGDREAARAPWVGEADTLLHSSRHMNGLPDNKLVTVSGSLGIPYTNGHRAEHDAAVAGEVFFAIRKKLKAKQARAIKAAQQDETGSAA